MLVNDKTLPNVIMLREIVQWANLDEEKNDIGCCWILTHCRMCSSSEKFFNDLFSMERKTASDVAGSWNSGKCVHRVRNSSMISSAWREKGHPIFGSHQALANAMMMGARLQWSHLVEEKKDIGCWSMIKHWRMWWCWEKLFNDLISMKRKTTWDVAGSSNVAECVHRQRNSSMI